MRMCLSRREQSFVFCSLSFSLSISCSWQTHTQKCATAALLQLWLSASACQSVDGGRILAARKHSLSRPSCEPSGRVVVLPSDHCIHAASLLRSAAPSRARGSGREHRRTHAQTDGQARVGGAELQIAHKTRGKTPPSRSASFPQTNDQFLCECVLFACSRCSPIAGLRRACALVPVRPI